MAKKTTETEEEEKKEASQDEMTEEEAKDIIRQRELIRRCRVLFENAKDHRRKYDWEWLVRHLFVRGYHYARYNRANNTVIFGTRTGVKIPINLVGAHLRGVRNQVTSFQPKWEVLPNVTTESASENARYSSKVLDYIYKKAQVKRKIKEAVNYALINSIGIWEFSVDKDKNIIINARDPYDVYIDPNIKCPNLNDPEYGAEFLFTSNQLPIDYVKNNKKYKNTDLINADNEPASAEYKKFLLQVTKNSYNALSEENETVILKQGFLRERNEKGDVQIRVVTFVDNVELPLYEEVLEDSEYPFEILQGDISSNELYGESWVKHLIPINRVIDALESHIFEYNHFFAKGRFVIDKNSGVRVIVNQHGQIIEKNRGSTVTPLPISPLPSTPMMQIENMRKYFEDLSGVHDVSLGRLPGTIRSGVAIAELKQADATNQNDLIDNLEDFLSRAGHKILKLVAENWDTTRLISITGLGGSPEKFMAVGERGRIGQAMRKKQQYRFGSMDLPIAIIGADNEVRVQIGSWLAYTKESRQEKLKELFRLGAIDQKTYLEYSEFADIDGIMQRTRDEQIMQARAGQPSASVQGNFGVQLDDQSLALAENELMLEGVDQPVEPDDDHEVHVMIHKEQEDNELVRAHINEHMKWQKWVVQGMAQPMPGPGQEAMPGADGEPIPPGESIGGMPTSGGIPGGIGEQEVNLQGAF